MNEQILKVITQKKRFKFIICYCWKTLTFKFVALSKNRAFKLVRKYSHTGAFSPIKHDERMKKLK